MKILHLGKYYPPESGGIESVTQILAQGHAQAGHSVEVFCFTHGAPGVESMPGLRVQRVPISRTHASQPLGMAYFKQGLRLAQEADVVHIHAPNLLAFLMATRIDARVRVVLHWHSDIISKGWLGRVVRPLERAALRRADAVIATSAPYAAHSPLLRSVPGKVHVVPIGIRRPGAAGGVLPQTLSSFLRGRKLVLGIGRLVPYKGFQQLVAASKHLPEDTAVVVAGTGPLQGVLQHAIDTEKLGDKVMLAGRVSDDVLHALFSCARVFCLPSIERSEAFGVVLLEAMARGIPSVATRIEGSGTSWVNEHGVSGLNVEPGDPLALAHACTRLLEDPALYRQLSEGAAARFESRFTDERFIRAVEEVYVG